jgi:GT2 family glycosyltransferase
LFEAVCNISEQLACVSQQLVVVDNASSDGSVEMILDLFPGLTIVRNASNLGYGAGNNKGATVLLKRHFPFLLFMNPDVFLFPGTLISLRTALVENRRGGCVGGVPISPIGGAGAVARRKPSFLEKVLTDAFWQKLFGRAIARRHFLQARELRDVAQVYALAIGACVMYRAEAFVHIGGFDERVFLHSEEFVMAERLARAGWSVLVSPFAQYGHIGGASMNQIPIGRRLHQIRSEQVLVRSYYQWSAMKCGVLRAIRYCELPYYCVKNTWTRVISERERSVSPGRWLL